MEFIIYKRVGRQQSINIKNKKVMDNGVRRTVVWRCEGGTLQFQLGGQDGLHWESDVLGKV